MNVSKHGQPLEQVGGRRRRAWIGTEMNRTMSRHPDLPGDDDHPLAALHKHGQPSEQVGGRRRRAVLGLFAERKNSVAAWPVTTTPHLRKYVTRKSSTYV